MRFKGKIIGGLIGLFFFGPVMGALGFIAGHLYDIGYFQAFIDAAQGGIHTQSQQIFFDNTFKIMGHIAKLDGRVSENEINLARTIMSQMGLNEAMKQRAMTLFSVGKQADFQLDAALFELRQVCRMQPALLQLFLEIQLQMANADGPLSAAKQATLQHICDQLGIAGFQSSQRQYRYQAPGRNSNEIPLSEAYRILEISQNATADEIKTAYRRAMSQNHPDKLIAKGLPPEMIKIATQKTQRIKQAYEEIKKAKGI